MKRVLTIIAVLVSMVIASCDKYDDTEIRNKIDALEERIAAIEALLKATADNLTVVNITETEEATVITFSNNSTISIPKTIKGNSPIVNIEVDGDMVYITLDDGTVLTFKKYEITENHKIYYTTSDKKYITWNGVPNNIVSNTYENNQGVLIFDKPVTTVGHSNAETLRSIVIPESVEKLGGFFNCKRLTELYCKAVIPPMVTGHAPLSGFLDFQYLNYSTRPIGCTIYVPMESVNDYKEAACWSDYASYIKGYNF